MGKVLTLKDDGTYSEDSKEGFLEKTVAGVTALFSDDKTFISSGIHRHAQLATNVANTIATSMYTRKRAEQGKAAFAKILF